VLLLFSAICQVDEISEVQHGEATQRARGQGRGRKRTRPVALEGGGETEADMDDLGADALAELGLNDGEERTAMDVVHMMGGSQAGRAAFKRHPSLNEKYSRGLKMFEDAEAKLTSLIFVVAGNALFGAEYDISADAMSFTEAAGRTTVDPLRQQCKCPRSYTIDLLNFISVSPSLSSHS
jgi:hypothetical protein